MGQFVVHGEITAESDKIVLMIGGSPYAAKRAQRLLELLTPLLKQPKPANGALLAPLTWPTVVQLRHTFGDAWRPHPRLTSWLLQQVSARCGYKGNALRYSPPNGASLYWWQVENAQLIAHTGQGLITDDPGLGKTMSAIVGLVERSLWDYPVLPIVCVVPPSVVDAWVRAFELWAPHWRTVAWRGTPAQRGELVGTADVYIASYPLARMDARTGEPLSKSPLVRVHALSLIIDECQMCKNPDAVQTRAVGRLAREVATIIGLSGTPISHNVRDMWPVLRMFYPLAYPSGERFSDRYAQCVNNDYGQPEVIGLNPLNEPEFRRSLLGVMTHHSQAECLPDLPPKRYTVREVQVPAAYLKAYKDMRDNMIAELPDGQEISVTKVLPRLTRLQQMAASAVDVEHYMEWSDKAEEMVAKQRVTLKMPSWKIEAMLEVLEERRRQQSIVFAVSKQLIVLAGAAAEKQGYRVGYIMGGQNIGKERTPTIDQFQAGEIDVIFVVTSAGGVGLTLTAADTEIFLQRPYKFDESVQCEGRAYGRVDGSALESVEIIDIRAIGTNDWAIPEVLYGKAGQLSEILQDPAIVRELFGGTVTPKKHRSREDQNQSVLAKLAGHVMSDVAVLVGGAR